MKFNLIKRNNGIDYNRIEKITRKVVKEELNANKNNDNILHDEEKLKSIIAQGILEAEKLKVEAEKERIKNTKISVFSIITMVVFALIAVFFALLSVVAFLNSEIINGLKMALVSGTYLTVIVFEYAVSKNNDKNFTFNIVSILLSLIPIIVTAVS